MKKIVLLILMVSFAVTGYAKKIPEELSKRTEFYYKLGCKALKHKDMEKAEECFLEATKTFFKEKNSDTFDKKGRNVVKIASKYNYNFEKDIENLIFFEEKNSNDNAWKIYYYKGFSEINLLYYYNELLENSNSINKKRESLKTAIKESLNKSILLYDNYQSHMLLYFYLNDVKELTKAIDLAKNNRDCSTARRILEYLASVYEYSKEFEKTISLLNKAQEYEQNKENEKKIKKLTEYVNLAKEAGYSSYKEYAEAQARIMKRQSWNNLYNYLATGNVGLYGPYERRHIPFEKGDIVEAQLMQLEAIDVDVVSGGYSYLVSSCGYSNFSKCCYIISKEQLVFGMAAMMGEKLKRIQCVGTAQYKSGYSIVDTYVFNVIE